MFTLYAKEKYEGTCPADIDRAVIIAACRIAQGGVSQLSSASMRRDVLTFLSSQSAVNHWLNTTGRLEKNPNDAKLLQLTTKGLLEIEQSLNGGGSLQTTSERVEQWVEQMKNGGAWTDVGPEKFNGDLVPQLAVGCLRTSAEAKGLMVAYYQKNKDTLPKQIAKHRDAIIEHIAEGCDVEEAFHQFVVQLETSEAGTY